MTRLQRKMGFMLNLRICSYLVIYLLLGYYSSRAMSKQEYYQDLFSSQYAFDLIQDDKVSNEVTPKLFTIQLVSEQKFDNLVDYRNNLILICDAAYESVTPYKFRCDTGFVESLELDMISGIARSVAPDRGILYVIPEDVLVIPSKMERLSHIFSAIRDSDSSLEASLTKNKSEDTRTLESSISQYADILKFIIGFILLSLLLWIFSLGKTSGLKVIFQHRLRVIAACCDKFTHYLIIPFVVLLVMYLPLLLVLNIRDGQVHNPFYAVSYFLDTMNPKVFIDALENNYYYRLFFFFYTLLMLNTLILILLPVILNAWRFVRSNLYEARFKNSVYKYAVPSLVFLGMALITLGVYKQHLFLPVFVMTTLVVLLFTSFRQGVSVHYSRNYKLVLIIVAVSLFLTNVYTYMRRDPSKGSSIFENLIRDSKGIVTLPIKIHVSEDTRFNEYLVSKTYSLFTDEYLIYSPDYSTISNKPLIEFTETGDYYIQGGTVGDKVRVLNENPLLIGLIGSTSPTSFIRYKNSSYRDLAKEMYMSITLYCSVPRLITSTYYYGEGASLENTETDLLYYPGCNVGEDSRTYTVPIHFPITTSPYIYIKLNNVQDFELNDLAISIDTIPGAFDYISTAGPNSVVKARLTDNTETIINYYISPKNPFSFVATKDSKGRTDIAIPLNELLSQKVFLNNFILWTPETYEIFRSNID